MNKYITCRQRHINKLIMCCGNVNGIKSNWMTTEEEWMRKSNGNLKGNSCEWTYWQHSESRGGAGRCLQCKQFFIYSVHTDKMCACMWVCAFAEWNAQAYKWAWVSCDCELREENEEHQTKKKRANHLDTPHLIAYTVHTAAKYIKQEWKLS